jgi:hypothetical protein
MATVTRWLAAVTAGILVFSVAAIAQAGTIASLVKTDGTVNDGHDLDGEYLHKGTGNSISGYIEVGDVIRGAIKMSDLNGDPTVPPTNDQWSGVFSLKVAAILNFDDNGTSGDLSDDTGTIVFEPDPGFASWVGSLDTDPATSGQQAPGGPAVATNAMVRLWTNSTLTARVASSTPTGVDANAGTAATGNFFWDLGFDDPSSAAQDDGSGNVASANGEGWVAPGGGLYFDGAHFTLSGTLIGTGYFGLSVLKNGTGFVILPLSEDATTRNALGSSAGATAQITGSSTVNGATGNYLTVGYDAKSTTDFNFLAVPLPSAALSGLLLLMGLGAGYGWRRRSRQMA